MLVYSGSEQYWKKWCQYLNTLFLKIQPHLLRTMTFLKKDWEQNVLIFFLAFIKETRLKIVFCVHQYICHTICTQSPKSEESIKEIELLQNSWIVERNKFGVHTVEKLHCELKRHHCFFLPVCWAVSSEMAVKQLQEVHLYDKGEGKGLLGWPLGQWGTKKEKLNRVKFVEKHWKAKNIRKENRKNKSSRLSLEHLRDICISKYHYTWTSVLFVSEQILGCHCKVFLLEKNLFSF